MKKNIQILLAVLALLLPLAMQAQIERGTQLVGANASLNSRNSDISGRKNVFSSSYNLNLRYGRFLATNFAVGLACPLTYSKLEQQSELNWGLGPFARLYSPFEDSKMNLLLEGRATYNQNIFQDKAKNLKRTTGLVGGGVGVGVIYFFNESVGMETLLDYNFLYSTTNSDKTGGISFNVGFQIYLNRYGF